MNKMHSKVERNIKANMHDIYEGFVNFVPDPQGKATRIHDSEGYKLKPSMKVLIKNY